MTTIQGMLSASGRRHFLYVHIANKYEYKNEVWSCMISKFAHQLLLIN
jgi:hypothetical protein